jgi:predicted nucleotidyltransferase
MPIADPEKVLRQLTKNKVRFIIIGGVATVLHGLAHTTYDLDLCYERTTANITRLVKALLHWHPRLRDAPKNLPFSFDSKTIQTGLNFTLSTDVGDLNLFGEVTGIGRYEDVKRSSEETDIFGLKCSVLSIEGLIKSKKAVGRRKDQPVLAELQALLDLKKRGRTRS